MKYLVFSLLALLLFRKQDHPTAFYNYDKVSVDTLLTGDFSSRAILVEGSRVWYAADKSRYGYYDTRTRKHIEKKFKPDTLEFRSIALNSDHVFLLNAGSPAFLVRADKETLSPELVHFDTNKKTFYDSMRFWNEREGIAMGDPTDNCLSILLTRDGGSSWTKIPCGSLPQVDTGEAAFAASNSNIVVKGTNTWIVTGGKKARVFFSPDKGKSWSVYDTPIISGKSMTGIFTADFYDGNTGFVAGGDYERLNRNQENKAVTSDGGKTWKLIAENKAFGYASCVQYVPGSNGMGLATVGASGLYYSADGGKEWKKLLSDYSLYTLRFRDDSTAFAAGKGKLIRIRFKK